MMLRRALALLLFTAFATLADAAPGPADSAPTARSPRATIVPDRFLRAWDPITVFFPGSIGAVGPLDDPKPFLSILPQHPGAYTWIDARTLQFRPAEPWPSLTRFAIRAAGRTHELDTLMAAPIASVPENGAEGLDPVEAVTLTFAERIDQAALARMATIELRPLPGIASGGSRWLTSTDFTVKALERSDKPSYVLALASPIPLGTRAVVRLRLTLNDDPSASFADVAFATAAPFRVAAFGCEGHRYPVSPAGSRYAREQIMRCDNDEPRIVVELSAAPVAIDPVRARNLVRTTPALPDLEARIAGRDVIVTGKFLRDTEYRVTLGPAAIADAHGRELESPTAEAFLFFPRRPDYLQLGAGTGLLERHGSLRVPIEGRGDRRVDLRIYPIDPLDRRFWPFPNEPLLVDESARPAGPGEEPAATSDPFADPSPYELQQHILLLGSPPVSALVSLPLAPDTGAARLGLDLTPHLTRLTGARKPGTYLVGLRRIDASSQRSWMRVQVTDLALTTLDEPDRVRFVVTSLQSGRPVSGTTVKVEGAVVVDGKSSWIVLAEGVADLQGGFTWMVPAHDPRRSARVRRIVVRNGDDTLVLDPQAPPERYADNLWQADGGTWLGWTVENTQSRKPQPETIAHIFTERPVYRPDDVVHIKGWVRVRHGGRLETPSWSGHLVVAGPADLEWRYPVTLGPEGGFYHAFREDERPAGDYHARLEGPTGESFGGVSFLLDAYRIPQIEVRLSAPDRVANDGDFAAQVAAVYYAGGAVAGRPLAWRVTQFPYAWAPAPLPGFRYSSDSRFSDDARFEATPTLNREDVTAADGGGTLTLRPTAEPNAMPRTYIIEATVTGPDDQTVTATRRVVALPPFVLGLEAPRFLARATVIEPRVVAVGHDGKLLPGTKVLVKLLQRRWHSHLRASDFSDGVARYLTDVVDEIVSTQTVTTTSDPVRLSLPIPGAGVYVIELEAHDRLGRAQVVSADLYAGGDEPVAWAKPPTRVFTAATDRESYAPGETANLVLASPFQKAEALAIIEAPEGNRYEWVPVRAGQATLAVPILGTYAPRLPVHLVLMRGRLDGARGTVATSGPVRQGLDLGKPTTMAATTWLAVRPVDNQIEVAVENPERALPGTTIDVTVRLKDPGGRPLAGEVALWLVDQAVLALGREQRLDPLPDFLTPAETRLEVRDTRNMGFGDIAFSPLPGGGEGMEAKELLDKTTVRRDFSPVPYFEPALRVGPDGVAVVKVKLPDSLTNFKLRAKAASGPRFGVGVSTIQVRLPVIAQPALPRFLRPGDRFTAAAIGRVVEGAGGPGRAELRVEGAELSGDATRDFTWVAERPERLSFAMTVPRENSSPSVKVTVGVERTSDAARDAFEVTLPVRDDRRLVRERLIADVSAGKPFTIPGVSEPARPGSERRSLLVSSEPALARMIGGLDFLASYPYGCTEQRLSGGRARLAFHRLRELLARDEDQDDLARSIAETAEWIAGARDARGLVAYWPGGSGYVTLSAWSMMFLVEARAADFAIDDTLFDGLAAALGAALRSDYTGFVDGEAWAERAWALSALALAGRYQPAYGAELARKSQFLDLEGKALIAIALASGPDSTSPALRALDKALRDGIVTRLHQGREIYAGLEGGTQARSALILPSETRTLASVARAMVATTADTARLDVLIDGLVTLGRGDGWGSTNANAEAILALERFLGRTPPPGAVTRTEATIGGRVHPLEVGGDRRLVRLMDLPLSQGELRVASGDGVVAALLDTSFMPATPGSEVDARTSGMVVSRASALVPAGGAAIERTPIVKGSRLSFQVGDIVEEHVQITSSGERHFVAITVPLAAGVEPLNPALATAPPEARPAREDTTPATYRAFGDDEVQYFFDTLAAGTYDFYFRVRATTEGEFTQPPAEAELMYDASVNGSSPGAMVVITKE